MELLYGTVIWNCYWGLVVSGSGRESRWKPNGAVGRCLNMILNWTPGIIPVKETGICSFGIGTRPKVLLSSQFQILAEREFRNLRFVRRYY